MRVLRKFSSIFEANLPKYLSHCKFTVRLAFGLGFTKFRALSRMDGMDGWAIMIRVKEYKVSV